MVTGLGDMVRTQRFEVALLDGQQAVQGINALCGRRGHDHGAHVLQAAAREEHMLGAAEADARGSVGEGGRASAGVSALARTLQLSMLRAQVSSCSNSG